MRMLFRRPAAVFAFVTAIALPLWAQHAGHDVTSVRMDSTMARAVHVMLQAVPLVTRADPAAGGAARTQFVLSQTLLMVRAGFQRDHGEIDAAFNAEGLTMPDGELNTGAFGEGYVD